MDEWEIGFQSLGMRASKATLERIQPDQILLRPRLVLESPKAVMTTQYIGVMARPDSSHIVDEIQIRDQHRELQRPGALLDCGVTCIFMYPQLLNTLRLPHKAAHITTHWLDGQVIANATENHKRAMAVKYPDHLAAVHEPEVLVFPMRAYNRVLGLQCFKTRKPAIVWTTG